MYFTEDCAIMKSKNGDFALPNEKGLSKAIEPSASGRFLLQNHNRKGAFAKAKATVIFMKIGVTSAEPIAVLGLEAGFQAIKNAGFDVMDFSMGCYFPFNYNGVELDEETIAHFNDEQKFFNYIERVKAAAETCGLGIGQCHAPAPSYFPKNTKNTEIMREAIRKSIRGCAKLGCKHIVVHPSFDGSARFPSLTKKEEYQENIAFYSSLIPLLKETGVICCLENMWIQDWKSKRAYLGVCSDMNETCRYIDELNAIAGEKCFAFCLDIGHLLMLGLDPYNAMETLGHRLELLHIHDNDGLHDDHTAPYLGICNWERFIKGIRKIGYRGNINFETDSFPGFFPKELVPDALKLLGATANYFRKRIEAPES